jgi:NADP-dependent 3-hydroxy acid dehydrogenase YdfG
MRHRGTAVVTGASSGIGAATARALAGAGFAVVLGARRDDRLAALAAEIGPAAHATHLDVTDSASVDAFCQAIPECRVLINNAGGALGLEAIAQADEAHWQTMYDTNVLGTMRMTRALLPKLVGSGDGVVVSLGSVAAFEPYAGGAGYNAAKHAMRAVMDVLRMELIGQAVRVSEIDPGLVDTEFSLVRFGGNEDRADQVYQGLTPLSAEDIAEVIAFVATRPSHVDIDRVVIRPRDQARVWLIHRDSPDRTRDQADPTPRITGMEAVSSERTASNDARR